MSLVNIYKNINVSNELPFTLIAGPCQIESKDHAHYLAAAIKEICKELEINLIYKSSYDKANRSSINGQRGIGITKGLEILADIKQEHNVPVITDIHECWQADIVKDFVDVIQIPAFLCRQTDLLLAAGQTGKPINVKKGQFLSPHDMKNVAQKIANTNNDKIMLCERGTTFGYNNLVVDFRSLEIMKETGYPVVFDATHSVQQPGGLGTSSGGDRKMVWPLARAACAIGVAALFMEIHDDPDRAPSDSANMIKLSDAKSILSDLKAIDQYAKTK
jgi:2-dehydro-3-deoxyphosphooctonate aldolase (KDO 8-P synthase)